MSEHPPWLTERFRLTDAEKEYHRAHPEISLESYDLKKRSETFERVRNKTRIYLDQRFWIDFRQTRTGKPPTREHQDIYELLYGLVESGRAVCPLGYPALLELFKQSDPVSLRNTARVIDDLC